MDALLPFLPQLITFALKLGVSILEMNKEITHEEMQRLLNKSYDEIAVKKRIKKNSETSQWEWV